MRPVVVRALRTVLAWASILNSPRIFSIASGVSEPSCAQTPTARAATTRNNATSQLEPYLIQDLHKSGLFPGHGSDAFGSVKQDREIDGPEPRNPCSVTTAVLSMVRPPSRRCSDFLADDGAFPHVETDPLDQGLDVGQMRTRRRMVVVLGHAGGQLHDDPVLRDALLLGDGPEELRELAMARPAAAAAAGDAQVSERLCPSGTPQSRPSARGRPSRTDSPGTAPSRCGIAGSTTYSLFARSVILSLSTA